MRIRWTTRAANDPYNIVRRIQRDNEAAAAKVATFCIKAATISGIFRVAVAVVESKEHEN
jgi:hypothetical protein